MMGRIFSFVFNRTTLVLVGLVAISLIVWFIGPLISIGAFVPLESEAVRLVVILAIFLLWGLVRFLRWWNARARNAALLNQIAQDDGKAAAAATPAGAEEIAELRRRFDAAISTLKQSRIQSGKDGFFARFSRRYVYQMPWYMIIGAPGSGKTTALVNSGIEFPLAKEFGKAAIRGVGGTRNCDWWFTNDAVLLDTAGRYTTQESNEALDHAEWTGFLSLLRKFRPRAPINGVLLTISIPDLLGTDEAERERHAAVIRRRFAEIDEALKTRFPIYVLVTKTDLLSGFNEFYARLSNDERAQVWGVTLPHAASESGAEPGPPFRAELALLQKRIEDALPDALQGELDVQRRGLVYAFPQELAGLREVLVRFLDMLFAPSKFTARPFVRGVYFTSGTQEGTPFDRVLSAIQRQFGVAASVQNATAAQGSGRSYFLRNLLQKVIFAEAHVVERNPMRDRRRRIVQAVGVTACVILLAGSLVAWIVSYSNNRSYIASVYPRATDLDAKVKAAPNTTDDDLISLLPILDEAQALPRSDKFDIDSPPLSSRFGLYQGGRVKTVANGAYDRLLEDLLLPRIALRIRRLLQDTPPTDLEALYKRLEAYLMLYDPEHYRAQFLLEAVVADWRANEASSLPIEAQKALEGHIARVFADRLRQSPFPIDEALVADARTRLASYTASQRLYSQIKSRGADRVAAANIPNFTLVTAVGPDVKLVFERTSGKSLDQGVPALFTRDGYRVFSALLQNRRNFVSLDEPWVLGKADKSAIQKASDIVDDRLVNDIRRQYLEEYRLVWDRFLTDVHLRQPKDLRNSIDLARMLSGPDSPLTKMIRVVAAETTLTETGKSTINATDRAVDVAKEASNQALSRVFGSAATRGRDPTPDDPNRPGRVETQLVDDYFDSWRRLAGTAQQPGTSEQLKQMVGELYSTLLATESALRSGMPPPPADAATKMRAEAARLPSPLRGMFEGLAATSSSQAAGVARSSIGALLDANVGDFCRKAIAGRYPFVRSSPRDVTPDDFARMFAPGGLMDDFFAKNLAQYVDTSTRPWSFRRGIDGAPAGSSASLSSFEKAAVIREVFFRGGSRAPQFRVDMKPVEMDASITTFALDADGTPLSYLHGPQTPRSIVWPGPAGRNQVRVALTPPGGGSSTGPFEGSWALHRFFDKAQITPSASPEKFLATFNFDGRKVAFEVTAASVQNPFKLRELEEFTCPGRL
jgi:type VI secretion system protein ImpL